MPAIGCKHFDKQDFVQEICFYLLNNLLNLNLGHKVQCSKMTRGFYLIRG